MELTSNNHSVFKLQYHLILVTKYRKKVINNDISIFLKNIFERIAPDYNIKITEWNHDCDHVHILLEAHPNTQMTKYINAVKSASSRLVKKEFPEIKNQLYKESFWSKSFCLLTTGGASIEAIQKYIQQQRQRTRKYERL